VYEVRFTPHAIDDLAQLDKAVAQRVLHKIRWLAENFEAITPESLTADWQGVYKLRVGDYRVLYTVEHPEACVIVHHVKHRSEVYKTR
jgi:mRNA interferase RelE/StbE